MRHFSSAILGLRSSHCSHIIPGILCVTIYHICCFALHWLPGPAGKFCLFHCVLFVKIVLNNIQVSLTLDCKSVNGCVQYYNTVVYTAAAISLIIFGFAAFHCSLNLYFQDTLDWADAALEPGSGSVSDAEDIWRRKGGDARQKNTDPVVHAVEQATTRETNKNKIDPNEGLNGQGGNALGAEDGTTQRGVTNIAKEELTTSLDLHANNNKGVSDAVHGAENGDDDVLDALLDLTVAESANTPLSAKTPLPSTINSAPASIAGIAQGMQLGSKVGVTRNISISTNNSTHGGSEKEQESEHALSGTRAHAKKTPALQQPVQQEETAALGSGSGDVGGGGSRVAGGSDADELEDWLDDMLADD